VRAVDEKHGVVDVVFLTKLGKERVSNYLVYRRFKLCIEKFVCLRIDSGVQLILLIIGLDHGFVNRDVIQLLS